MLKTIFVVDDNDTNLTVAENVLEKHHRVITMSSAARMFVLLEKFKPDLILLDIKMPGMDGLEALRRLKSNASYMDVPVMFLTGVSDTSAEAAYGFELGAVDFVTKPFSPPVLLNRIQTHLDIDELIRERTARLWKMKTGIISVMAELVESRDNVTGGHVERTTKYVRLLIDTLLERGLHTEIIQSWDIDMVVSSSRLHDIGKIAVSDLILNKPGKLTAEEFEAIKRHTTEGERIIEQMAAETDEEAFFYNARIFAGFHHERWDGGGYPHGTKGEETPLQGRIMAIADVYDALISERPYKKAFPPEEAERIIMESAGKHFDPVIADLFYEMRGQFRNIGGDES
ncbi:MAG: response regulator [Oscillospiraceae bacterium]|jgi:putative two-component system response regulator|nr:response regulator [Oscillospiraceae bacterium]